jgi:hypothetical protein
MFLPAGVSTLSVFFTKPDTQQTYQLFVGKNIPETSGKDFAATNVVFGYKGLTLPFNFTPAPKTDVASGAWKSSYNPAGGILTLTAKMSQLASIYSLNTAVPNETWCLTGVIPPPLPGNRPAWQALLASPADGRSI